jgi:hypothetical protein
MLIRLAFAQTKCGQGVAGLDSALGYADKDMVEFSHKPGLEAG